jgi:hypothetical protein
MVFVLGEAGLLKDVYKTLVAGKAERTVDRERRDRVIPDLYTGAYIFQGMELGDAGLEFCLWLSKGWFSVDDALSHQIRC